jgi:hypothetical protein
MMIQTEALKLALDWFKCYADKSMSRNNAEALADEVVDAIEKALAQTQEPDYWLGFGLQAHTEKPFENATPLYTTPPQRKPLTDDLYYKLLFAVENRYPDETRHQNALRYIRQAEMSSSESSSSAHNIKE